MEGRERAWEDLVSGLWVGHLRNGPLGLTIILPGSRVWPFSSVSSTSCFQPYLANSGEAPWWRILYSSTSSRRLWMRLIRSLVAAGSRADASALAARAQYLAKAKPRILSTTAPTMQRMDFGMLID